MVFSEPQPKATGSYKVLRPKMNTCFVIMPFGGYFDAYYLKIIKPAVASAGLKATRADEIYGTSAIMDDIHKKYREC